MQEWGRLDDGRVVHRLVLGREPGVVLHLLTLGATVHRIEVTGGDGVRRNVALGHATPADYLASGDYVGGTVGRYANRIAGGRFVLDGREVEVAAHDRGNSLHGGPDGFDRRLWTVEEYDGEHAVLRLDSPDGDQGFPGALTARARWEVDGDVVRLTLGATTDAPTVANLTSHVYLNLDGAGDGDGAGTIDDHELTVAADLYTPVDATGIPTGEHAAVAGTPFDLLTPTRLGTAIRSRHEQVAQARGFDHNVVLRGSRLRTAAVLRSRRTSTTVTMSTDQPGLQVYTGNAFDGSPHRQYAGIALEPQLFPDTPHHPEWPSARLDPGEAYRSRTEWHFSPL